MPARREDLFARLAELGISTETFEHPPVFTVEEAREHCGALPGTHCKSLFLKDKKGALYLVVARDSALIDLKALAKALGAGRFSFGQPELLLAVLGVSPGSVTPFALINDTARRLCVVLDRTMMAGERLNYHPLTNRATTAISPADLSRFIAAYGQQVLQHDFAASA